MSFAAGRPLSGAKAEGGATRPCIYRLYVPRNRNHQCLPIAYQNRREIMKEISRIGENKIIKKRRSYMRRQSTSSIKK